MPRQQRTQNNRGQLQTPNRRTVGDMGWTLSSITGALVQVTLFGVTGDVVLKGVPDLVIVGGPAIVSIGLSVPATLIMTFADVIPPNPTFIWPSLDPAVRTSLGAFVAPAAIQFVSPFGTIPDTAIVANTGTLEAQKCSVLDVDGGVVALPPATDGQWAVLQNPPIALLPITVNFGGSSWSVDPGTSGRFQYTTPAWARL